MTRINLRIIFKFLLAQVANPQHLGAGFTVLILGLADASLAAPKILAGPKIRALPPQTCASIQHEVPVGQALASAAAWENLRHKPNSITGQAKRLLAEAESSISKLSPPTDLCTEPCRIDPKPQIVLVSTPEKLLSKYSDQSKCQKLQDQTKNQPITYSDRQFHNLNAFVKWLSLLCRGAGGDGEDLYSRCDGACSPQYSSSISKEGTGYKVDASIICGHARDKSANNYSMSTKIRWTCRT